MLLVSFAGPSYVGDASIYRSEQKRACRKEGVACHPALAQIHTHCTCACTQLFSRQINQMQLHSDPSACAQEWKRKQQADVRRIAWLLLASACCASVKQADALHIHAAAWDHWLPKLLSLSMLQLIISMTR
jgi:hypothetical protein